MLNYIIIMESTEARYDFYKRSFNGGAVVQTSEQTPVQPQTQEQPPTPTPTPEQIDGTNQINGQVPKTKIDFKISSIIGNLDQTLGSKQRINIDSLFVKQIFGIN
mgnify:CR=1 FL=1